MSSSFCLQCLTFIKCCSGAQRAIDTACGGMTRLVVRVSLRTCMLKWGLPEMVCEKGGSYVTAYKGRMGVYWEEFV